MDLYVKHNGINFLEKNTRKSVGYRDRQNSWTLKTLSLKEKNQQIRPYQN